jgi:hypothetical protein
MAEQRPGLTLQQRSLVLRCRGQLPLGMQQKGPEAERPGGFTSINSIDRGPLEHSPSCCYMGHANVAYEELALAASPF